MNHLNTIALLAVISVVAPCAAKAEKYTVKCPWEFTVDGNKAVGQAVVLPAEEGSKNIPIVQFKNKHFRFPVEVLHQINPTRTVAQPAPWGLACHYESQIKDGPNRTFTFTYAYSSKNNAIKNCTTESKNTFSCEGQ